MVLPKNELMEKIKTSNTIQNKTIFQTCQKRWDAVINWLRIINEKLKLK